MNQNYKSDILKGIKSGFPIFIGYFAMSVAYGIIAKGTGFTCFEAIFFSTIVYAGAGQYITLNLLNSGAAMGQIVVTIFLINFRHFLMSASLSAKLKDRKLLPLLSFGITDESFAVAYLNGDNLSSYFTIALNTTSHSGWILGSAVGFLAGNFLPAKLQTILTLSLYIMFIGILVPAVKREFKVLYVILIAGLINVSLGFLIPSGNWNLIISIIIASIIGSFILDIKENSWIIYY